MKKAKLAQLFDLIRDELFQGSCFYQEPIKTININLGGFSCQLLVYEDLCKIVLVNLYQKGYSRPPLGECLSNQHHVIRNRGAITRDYNRNHAEVPCQIVNKLSRSAPECKCWKHDRVFWSMFGPTILVLWSSYMDENCRWIHKVSNCYNQKPLRLDTNLCVKISARP